MAKTGARKKVAKKTARKKKATRKKAATAPDSNDVFPEKLLRGKKVCLTGRFTYYPHKDALTKWVRSEGGKITDKVDAKLDLLLVGEGKKSVKQKTAEKLNSQDGAGIEIVDDVKDLVSLSPLQFCNTITTEKGLLRLAGLLDTDWLRDHSQILEIEDHDFRGKSIATSDKRKWTCFSNIAFKRCDFSKGKIRNVTLGHLDALIEECQFTGTHFDEAHFDDATDCEFIKNKATTLRLRGDVKNCRFESLNADEFHASHLKGCVFQNCKIGELHSTTYVFNEEVIDCNFLKCKIGKIESEQIEFQNCYFEDCELAGVQSERFEFKQCKFKNVIFKDSEFENLAFSGSDLKNCTLRNCTISLFNLDDSKVSGCKLIKSECVVVQATDKQRKQIAGLQEDSTTKDAGNYKKAQQFAKVLIKSKKLNVDLDGSDAKKKKVKLHIHFNGWWFQAGYKAGAAKKPKELELHSWDKPQQNDYIVKLLALVKQSNVDSIDLGSLKTRTSGCSLKPKELKQLVSDMFYELMDKEPVSAKDIAKAEKDNRKKAVEVRADMLEQLKNGQVAAFLRLKNAIF